MPLIKSKNKSAIGKNIATEKREGNKSTRQAIAIALDIQRRAKGKPSGLSNTSKKRGK